MKIYSTKEASQYLGISVQGVKHHIYVAKDLPPDGKVGRNLFFSQETLDIFREQIQKQPGRPPAPNRPAL